jgi:hypothetical protein
LCVSGCTASKCYLVGVHSDLHQPLSTSARRRIVRLSSRHCANPCDGHHHAPPTDHSQHACASRSFMKVHAQHPVLMKVAQLATQCRVGTPSAKVVLGRAHRYCRLCNGQLFLCTRRYWLPYTCRDISRLKSHAFPLFGSGLRKIRRGVIWSLALAAMGYLHLLWTWLPPRFPLLKS